MFRPLRGHFQVQVKVIAGVEVINGLSLFNVDKVFSQTTFF